MRRGFAVGVLLAGLSLAGCAERLDVGDAPPSARAAARWRQVLAAAVDEDGRVDYARIRRQRAALRRYLRWVAMHGPESDAMRESAEDRRIAFLVNAYNAAVVEGVLRHWPIRSVRDVRIGVFGLVDGASFFWGQQVRVDKEWVTLYHLEKHYIVDRYQEPLVHVALNCASRSCPPLRWWEDDDLQDEMEAAMRRWLAGPALRREGAGYAASELFRWYRDDFLDWTDAPTLCAWMADYTEGEAAAWMRAHAEDCRLAWIPWDWTLNAKRLPGEAAEFPPPGPPGPE